MPKATVNIAIHVTLEEHAALTAQAQEQGISLSKLIRKSLGLE